MNCKNKYMLYKIIHNATERYCYISSNIVTNTTQLLNKSLAQINDINVYVRMQLSVSLVTLKLSLYLRYRSKIRMFV